MADFKHIKPTEISDNAVKLISDDWMLITSANDTEGMVCGTDYNTMTASWGGMGFLWGRPVVFVFIRPQRHTFPFAEANDRLTLSFFDESYRPALSYCGKFSGRDVDKARECGLTPDADKNDSGRAVWFDEARLVIKAKKLYAEWIKPESMTDPAPMYTYANGDFHKMYVCEITDVLVKEA